MSDRGSRAPASRLTQVAVALGVVAVLAAGVLIAFTLAGGSRPEEAVAADYLDGFFGGEPSATYELTAPAYRSLVLPGEHRELVTAMSEVVGDEADVRVLGSERSPGASPPRSLVGYQGDTAVGPVEGVMTLVRPQDDWRVLDISYDFAEAPAGATDDLNALTRRLNEQLRERADEVDPPNAPATTP